MEINTGCGPEVSEQQSDEASNDWLSEIDGLQREEIIRSVQGGAKNIQDVYLLSPLQEGILFHHLVDETAGAYVLTHILEVGSRSTLDRLIAALQAVVDRHDVLRTAVVWKGVPKPLQVVYRRAQLRLSQFNLEHHHDIRSQLIQRSEDQQRGWDLQHAPLVHLELAEDPSNSVWYAILQVHHIICDHRSLRNLVAEVAAHMLGRTDELPEPTAYRTHVDRVLEAVELDEGAEFFRGKLCDVTAPSLVFEHVTNNQADIQIEECRQRIDETLAGRIRMQAQRAGVSSARMFHAAWGLVVASISGREDAMFGTVVLASWERSARDSRLMGMAINTLPLRLCLRGMNVREFVAYTERELSEVLKHEQVPLVVARSGAMLPASTLPFNSLLNYRHVPYLPEAEWAGIGIRLIVAPEAWTNFAVVLTVDDLREGFDLIAQSDTRIGAPRILRYMATALESLTRALASTPECAALGLQVVPDSELKQVVEKFNDVRALYPRDRLIHQLFEDQVERAPNDIAAIHDGREVSYAELNTLANRLAMQLSDAGVGPDKVVGICVDRSIEMLVGLLAILKAGGAFLPLDPSYPRERLQYMIEDAGPCLILTQRNLRSILSSMSGEVVEIDSFVSSTPVVSTRGGNGLGVRQSAESLVYLIYTSGSTGWPKGTAMPHRAMANLIHWHQETFGKAGQTVLQFAALSFDVAFQEIFSTLCTGGRLVLLDEWIRRDPREMLTLLKNEGVNRLFLPPLMLQNLAECFKTDAVADLQLRDVITAGEQLKISPEIRLLFDHLRDCRLHNHYGPTESHVVTSLTLAGDQRVWPTTPAIGRPIANSLIYVLNSAFQPAPVDVVGEVYIGGANVSRGYFQRPGLTAERFIADPFSTLPGARMYRTGDLGRWSTDGSIDYVGRNDDQIKVRGYRIELAEVEARLAGQVDIREAVVVAREDASKSRRLVAYVTPRSSGGLSVEKLRAQLKAALPDYMVPSAIVILDALPTTPSGKVDRRALPEPEINAYVRREYQAPQGKIEVILAEIWRELLNVERVGRTDNFFELGGHSLLMVAMMERLRRVGLAVSVRRIFECSSLAELAGSTRPDRVENLSVPANAIPATCEMITPDMLPLVELGGEQIRRVAHCIPGGMANIQDIYPLAPLQEGILFHHLLDKDKGDTYIVLTLLSVSSRERLDDLIAAIQSVIDRHDILRTAVLWERLPQPVQVVSRRVSLPVDEIVLTPGRGAIDQIRERMNPAYQRMNVGVAPMVRLQVAADPEGPQWYAVLKMHHLTHDHDALETMFAEIVAHLEGRARSLPGPVPYRNHVSNVLARARVHDAEAYFRRKLSDVEETTAPFGLIDVHGNGALVQEVSRAMQDALARRIRLQARKLGISPATLFHVGWALVVAHTSGRDDVVFGTLLLGRLQGGGGAQRALGMFMNTLPIRLRIEELTISELVKHAQEELIELLDFEEASLAAAQRCSGMAGASPLFSSLLNFRHSIDLDLGFASAGVTVHGIQSFTNYPIAMSVDDLTEGFVLTPQTDGRVSPDCIADYLACVMESVCVALEEEASVPALSLAMLPAHERRKLVQEFSPEPRVISRGGLIHAMFEEQVRRNPDAVAIEGESEVLTYSELNKRSNQLARHLRELGVGPDQRVAICLERGPEMVVGILGALKAGGAYVPLDPNYPQDRLAYLLRDCTPTALLTQTSLKGQFVKGVATNVVSLDEVWPKILLNETTNLEPVSLGLQPHHLAYVIYTSGSTGQPKGVMVEHQNVTRLFDTTEHWFHFDETDVWTLFHSFSFDFSVWELWGALRYGGRLVLVSYWMARSPRDFYRMLCQRGVTVLNQTPSAFAQLIDAQGQEPEMQHSLRLVIFGGEALDLHRLRPWIRHNPLERTKLINMYGITETTVHVTYCSLTESEITSERGSPIGRSIPDLQLRILDRRGSPVPVGVTGEICVGGGGVARGYLHRPDLTAARFVADPFGNQPRARLYRSGDLGRWRSNGTIEYLGRRDQQVKIRGFRIELGEIEAQLAQHDRVKDCVVTVREDTPGDKRLVAYVVPVDSTDADAAPSAELLQAYLRARLPEHMVPGAFVLQKILPLTANGKLDRRALPPPERESYVSRTYEAPVGDVETALAGIWKDLLQLDVFGRRDSFFDLGGHSLLALKVLYHIDRVFDVTLDVSDIYKSPTLQELAGRIHGNVIADEFVDLGQEAQLDDDIRPTTGSRSVPSRSVLLTGATGFVGRFILAQLLHDTDAKVHCLVRASSRQQAAARLRETLVRWGLWREQLQHRIEAVPGDLDAPLLGLDEVSHAKLSKEIDSIYHCATSMNHLETYRMAKRANVCAIQDLLRIATHLKPKQVNYISTLSVFSDAGLRGPRAVDEASSVDHEKHRHSQGYAASKWVGEKLFSIASERGVPCNIFRLGLVWADGQQGRYDELQREYRIIKSCLLSGFGIRNYRYGMPPTPVDYVARSIVTLATGHPEGRGIFHISSSRQSVDGVFECCARILGMPLTLQTAFDWKQDIRRFHDEGWSLPVMPLLEAAFATDQSPDVYSIKDMSLALTTIECGRTHRELEKAGVHAPEFGEDQLRVLLKDMLSRDEEVQRAIASRRASLKLPASWEFSDSGCTRVSQAGGRRSQ
jgi:amino acid adenylation domain-containing protein/thioester reductase-like protein